MGYCGRLAFRDAQRVSRPRAFDEMGKLDALGNFLEDTSKRLPFILFLAHAILDDGSLEPFRLKIY